MEAHYQNLNKKLVKLQQNHLQHTKQTERRSQHVFCPSTVNLTNFKFTEGEQELLDMGMQYSLQQPLKAGWTNLIVETEQAIKLLDTRMQDAYRILAAKKIKQLHYTHNNNDITHKRQAHLAKNIHRKINQNNAMITQADKGKTTVTIYKQDYHNKVRTLVSYDRAS